MPDLDNRWSEILQEALNTTREYPIQGSRFRLLVNRIAQQKEMSFPPPDAPTMKFLQLLEGWPELISILRRPGQDFLVAPAAKAEILSNEVKEQPFGIRRDLFEAITYISKAQPYYDKQKDRVTWVGEGLAKLLPTHFVLLPRATEQDALEQRREFALLKPENIRLELMQALGSEKPLQAFGTTVKLLGLHTEWHSFRTKKVLDALQEWARINEIAWRDAWLVGKSGWGRADSQLQTPMESTCSVDVETMTQLFCQLEPADLQRISIPLDLVMKAFNPTKRR